MNTERLVSRFPVVVNTLPLRDIEPQGEAWLLAGDIDQHSPLTIGARRDLLRKLAWFLRTHGHDEASLDSLRRFLSYVTNGHLRNFFRWLVDEGVLTDSPMARILVPTARPDQIQPFARDQVEALLAAAGQSDHPRRNRAILWLMLDTGIRASELSALRRRDCDFTGRLDLSRLPDAARRRLRPQLVAPTWKLDSQGRRVVEPKADTKKRLKRSPDDADALNLAYGYARPRYASGGGAQRVGLPYDGQGRPASYADERIPLSSHPPAPGGPPADGQPGTDVPAGLTRERCSRYEATLHLLHLPTGKWSAQGYTLTEQYLGPGRYAETRDDVLAWALRLAGADNPVAATTRNHSEPSYDPIGRIIPPRDRGARTQYPDIR